MRTWIRLAVPLALLPSLTSYASGKPQPKDNHTTRAMGARVVLGPQASMTESQFIASWNSPALEGARKQARNAADLDTIFELNREAAAIWDDLRNCHRSAKDPEAETRLAYLQGTLCASDPNRNPEFQHRIADLQSRVESFAATTWIGGNFTPLVNERLVLPAAHPFLAEILMERISLRVHTWGTSEMEVNFNAPMPLRSGETPSAKDAPGSNAVVGEILLLGAMPPSLGMDRVGFYACPAYGLVNLSQNQFQGNDLAGWKARLTDIQNYLSPNCVFDPKTDGKKDGDLGWNYLDVYHWMALRYGAEKPKGYTDVQWGFLVMTFSPGGFLMHGVRYKNHVMRPMYIVIAPMAATAVVLRLVLTGMVKVTSMGQN